MLVGELAPRLLMWGNMRNLGLALVLIGSITAPHAAQAKKQPIAKRGRAVKPSKQKKTKATREAPEPDHDQALADAVAKQKSEPRPVMTSTVAPSPAPVAANPPVNMSNQVLDDEVPGTKKK